MTPYELAHKAHSAEPSRRSFTEDIEAHLFNGFVFSTPAYFVMGRPVVKDADPALIVNPWHVFPMDACDCWHTYLMAGDISRVWERVPWPLPWLSFERKNELRFIRLEAMKRLALPSPCATKPVSPVSFLPSRTP